jgi:hypothetical protein
MINIFKNKKNIKFNWFHDSVCEFDMLTTIIRCLFFPFKLIIFNFNFHISTFVFAFAIKRLIEYIYIYIYVNFNQ